MAAEINSLGQPAGLHKGARVEIVPDLYEAFEVRGQSLVEVTWAQHLFHEKRRWSAASLLDAIDINALNDLDKVCVWNAGRAELTTKPGADRVHPTGRRIRP